MKGRNGMLAGGIAAIVVVGVAVVGLITRFGELSPSPVETAAVETAAVTPEPVLEPEPEPVPPPLPELPPIAVPAPPPAPAPPPSRRLPVAGMPGHVLVVAPDGSSFVEDQDGKRVQLTAPTSQDRIADPREVEEKLTAALASRARAGQDRKSSDGQLVVLDRGVVEVPRGAVVTFLGSDHLVTHDENGTTVYHVDGRVEHRKAKAP